MKALPNDVNQLDDFYKDALKDLTIEPDSSVWANIETALNTASPIDSTSGTQATISNSVASKSMLASAKIIKVATIVALSSVIVGTATYFLMNEKKPIENSNKAIIPASVDSMPILNQENTKKIDVIELEKSQVTADNKLKKNNTDINIIQVDDNTKNTISEDANSDVLENISKSDNQNTETDSIIVENKTIQEEKENKVIKKPKSFYEKYAEKLKDSTRDIFVPLKPKK